VLGHAGTSEQPYRFAGEHYDPLADMQYHRARWYDPATGRFAALDPFDGMPSRPATLHKYAYANGDPINVSDPSGAFGIGSFAAGISIGITLASFAQTSIDLYNFAKNPTAEGAHDIAIGFALTVLGAGGFRLLKMISPSFRGFLSRIGKLGCQSKCYVSMNGQELEEFTRRAFKGISKKADAIVDGKRVVGDFDSISDEIWLGVKQIDGFRDDNWLKYTQQFSNQLKVATAHNKPYGVVTNGRVPERWRIWFENKGIRLMEFID
jgi:RHS repeat-associated protein